MTDHLFFKILFVIKLVSFISISRKVNTFPNRNSTITINQLEFLFNPEKDQFYFNERKYKSSIEMTNNMLAHLIFSVFKTVLYLKMIHNSHFSKKNCLVYTNL